MEDTKSQPLYISDVVNELFNERCTFEDGCEDWQDLEYFWGAEKYRLQDVDGQTKPLSKSLEDYFLHGDFLEEPTSISENKISQKSQSVRGSDIKDIPTVYTISGLRPQELVVIGTYIDKDIIPGFRYKVRKNLSEEYLFDGKAKYLERVGLGFGKRITFEGDSPNENDNYFWSDSRAGGYGFLFQTVENGEVFNILDTKTEKHIGRVTINNPTVTEDVVLTTMVGERGYVEKEVEIQFNCNVALNNGISNIFMEDIIVKGKAIIIRENMTSKAKISQIFLDNFVVDACLLLPEEYF